MLRRNVLPNVVSPVWSALPLRAGRAILSESSLSFLGVGIRTPQASWGSLIQYAANLTVLAGRPWVWVPPAVCMILTVLCLQRVGDGLRDALDPRTEIPSRQKLNRFFTKRRQNCDKLRKKNRK